MLAPPYRTAVIGRTGRGDYGHGLDTAALHEPKLKIIAVADENEKGRATAAKRLNVTQTYADYREMLEREKPEFVIIGPRWLDGHKEMILTCTDHGVRGIFCEKPMAPDLASCDAIVDACDRSHVKFAMAFQTRYSPRYAKVKELIKVGAIGDLLEIRARGKEDRRGGGEDLMVLGVHVFDLCHDLLGEPSWCFSRVTDRGKAITAQEVRQGAEGIGPLAGDRVDAMFGFQGTNVVAHFATSRPKEPGKRFGLTINGSKGSIWMGTGFTPPAFLLRDATWTSTGTEKWTPIKASEQDTKDAPPTDLTNGNSEILRDLIHAVESDTQALTDARAGRVAIEMVLACYASSVKGGIVHMPLVDRKNHPLTGLGKG